MRARRLISAVLTSGLTTSIGIGLVFLLDAVDAPIGPNGQKNIRVEDIPRPVAYMEPPVIQQDHETAPDDTSYRGCWAGMAGGLLKITQNRIYDLGSQESLSITTLRLRKPVDRSGLQTGVTHLFEARGRLTRSFLNRVIQLSFNSDKTVGFSTYRSTDDYLDNVIAGQGLFQRIDCLIFLPKRAP
jgi:hypothetical protein